ncbi:hypothetical protein CRG98_019081 [Punica granatum]|uniref:Uncharacterized protein n=1 Tax=Punica granatum TaxID=22663 RepID=A0A2I0JWF0_PUNGR|nr:hypothetical protein CRG98_019081 [Punica granatum]
MAILGQFESFYRVHRRFDVQFESRTSNTRSIETRASSQLNFNPSGTHDIFFPLLKTKLAKLHANDHHRGSIMSREPLTLPQNSIRRLRGDIRPDLCQTGQTFRTCSIFRDLCRAVRVDSITLGLNDHYSHLWGLNEFSKLLAGFVNRVIYRDCCLSMREMIRNETGKLVEPDVGHETTRFSPRRNGRVSLRLVQVARGFLSPF